MQIDSALLKIKNIDAKIQGMLLKNEENWISISSVTNIQHKWKVKMLQLHPETQLMLINAILTNTGNKIDPVIWAGLPLTENQLIAFITNKGIEGDDPGRHNSIVEMYRYLDDIVNNYSASLTPAMKEHIIKMFPTPLDKPVPTESALTVSKAAGAGLYMHELELLLKLFSPQELLQKFPDPNSNIWNTNQDMCNKIEKRKYTITLERDKATYAFTVTQPQYCDPVTASLEEVNITDIKIDDIILAATAHPESMDDFEAHAYYDDANRKDILRKRHKHAFKVLDITYK